MIETFKEELRKGKYTHGSNWSFDWYIDDIFCKAMAYGKNPVYLGYSQAIIGDEFLSYPQYDKIIDNYKDFFHSPTRIKSLILKQNKILNNAKSLIRTIETNKELELSRYYKVQFDLSLLMASVSVVFDKLIETEIENMSLKEKASIFDISSYVIDKSSVTKLNESSKRLLELHKINNNLKASDLKQHAIEFGWLNTGERGKQPWNEKDFLKQLQGLLNKKPQITSVKPELSLNNGLILDSIIRINKNDNIASDLQVELDYLFQEFLKLKLGKLYDERIVAQLTFSEIKTAISKPSTINDFSERKNNFKRVLFPYKQESVSLYLSKSEYQETKSLLQEDTHKDTLIISGSVACQGNVVGFVRLVKNLDDLKSFKKGEIIVASMTQPSYTPYMIDALGIVTDIGGITSHAAIISREFNIPCIVGTQNATKILKTGDKIAVNTDKGTVEIL